MQDRVPVSFWDRHSSLVLCPGVRKNRTLFTYNLTLAQAPHGQILSCCNMESNGQHA
jgi:hypothetical protein